FPKPVIKEFFRQHRHYDFGDEFANHHAKHRLSKAGSVALAWVTGAGRRNRFVHDAADGARAAAALDAAAEATIDLAGGARRLFSTDRGAHGVVSHHVAKTDNHGSSPHAGGSVGEPSNH